jgi:ribosome maturation factor RimP
MIDKNKLAEIIGEQFKDGPLFLVDLKVSPRNRIVVWIDGDQGVAIADCVALSRHIESLLDRDAEDFELEVTSAGVGAPMKLLRQFRKNTGRMIQLILEPEGRKLQGRLAEVSEEGVRIEPAKKKNEKDKKSAEPGDDQPVFFPFGDIREAKVVPSFK